MVLVVKQPRAPSGFESQPASVVGCRALDTSVSTSVTWPQEEPASSCGREEYVTECACIARLSTHPRPARVAALEPGRGLVWGG